MRTFLLFFYLLTNLNSAFANNNEAFMLGIKNYQQNNFPAAIEEFNKALVQDPKNAAILTNLGLAQYKSGKNYLAIAYFRKAIQSNPWLETPREGLDFVLQKTQIKPLTSDVSTYQNIRDFTKQLNLPGCAFAACVSFLLFGLTLIQYLVKKKKAEQEEIAPPSTPWLNVFVGFLSLGLILMSTQMFYDSTLKYGTIIADKSILRVAPDDQQIELAEMNGGLEVEIGQIIDGWVQITYGGTLTGWVKKEAVFY